MDQRQGYFAAVIRRGNYLISTSRNYTSPNYRNFVRLTDDDRDNAMEKLSINLTSLCLLFIFIIDRVKYAVNEWRETLMRETSCCQLQRRNGEWANNIGETKGSVWRDGNRPMIGRKTTVDAHGLAICPKTGPTACVIGRPGSRTFPRNVRAAHNENRPTGRHSRPLSPSRAREQARTRTVLRRF